MLALGIGNASPILDPRFATRERQPGLDLLRAGAVVLVVCYHAGLFGLTLPWDCQRFGWIGVDLFFVLSGYLIGGQLLTPLTGGSRIDLPRFFWRRALRILPAYLAVLAIYTAFPARREFPDLPPLWKFLTFVQNVDLRGGTAFSHAWSLCVEAQFYLVLPFLLMLIVPRRHAGMVVGATVILAGMVLRALLASYHPALSPGSGVSWRAFQRLIYYPTWTRLDPLVCGVGLAALERFRPERWQGLTRQARWLLLPGFASIAGGLYLGDGDVLTLTACVWEFPLIALGMSLLLVCAVSEELPFRRLPVPGAAYLASVAYSVYLSHKLALHWVLALCGSHHLALTSARAIGLNLSVIGLAGSVLFFAVERPFLQLRRRTTRHPRRERPRTLQTVNSP